MENESNGDTNRNWYAWNGPQRLGKEAGRVGNRKTSRNLLNYSIVKTVQNTEKSPGDLSRPAVT